MEGPGQRSTSRWCDNTTPLRCSTLTPVVRSGCPLNRPHIQSRNCVQHGDYVHLRPPVSSKHCSIQEFVLGSRWIFENHSTRRSAELVEVGWLILGVIACCRQVPVIGQATNEKRMSRSLECFSFLFFSPCASIVVALVLTAVPTKVLTAAHGLALLIVPTLFFAAIVTNLNTALV